jgi:hypothetical protein
MNFILTAGQTALTIPVSLLFWCFVIALPLHVLEESVLGDVFVEKVKRLYWPEYNWKKFTGFNTLFLLLNISAVILFECFGGAWLIFPMALAFERILNGVYHLYETAKTHRFSSGLLSSVIFWILGYLLIRYSIVPGQIAPAYLIASIIIGFCIELFMTGFMFIAPFRKKILQLAESRKKGRNQ